MIVESKNYDIVGLVACGCADTHDNYRISITKTLDGFNRRPEQVEERISKLEGKSNDPIWIAEIKSEEKWTAPEGTVEPSNVPICVLLAFQKERRKGKEQEIIWIMAWRFSNLKKDMNIHIQEAHWTSKITSD